MKVSNKEAPAMAATIPEHGPQPLKEATVDTKSVPKETPDAATRTRGECAGCGEPAGSISAGTGFPLVRNRRGDGLMYHVRCLPGTHDLDAVWSGLERMGG